nr:hypothetical protein [Tanacetum cinerariifolium]
MKDFLLDTLCVVKHLEYLIVEPHIVQETLHVNFLENKPNVAEKAGEEVTQTYVLFPVLFAGSMNPQNNDKDVVVDGKEHDVDTQKSESDVIHSSSSSAQTRKQVDKNERVNTPRSDEDRLEILELTVFMLQQSDASDGFDQIIDFLNGSYIKYALTVNPHIYVSCIKQFWNTVTVKQSTDVTRVGKGFSGVETPLFEGMLVENVVEGIADEQVQDDAAVAAALEGVTAAVEEDIPDAQSISSPSPPPQDLPSTSQMQHTPPSSPQPQPQAQPQTADFPLSLLQTALDTCAALTNRIEQLKSDKLSQALEITQLKKGTSQRVDTSYDTIMEDVSNQGRRIVELDRDVELMGEKKKTEQAKDIAENESAEVEEVVEVVTTAKLITEVTAASNPVSAVSITILAAEPQVPAATPIVILVVAAYTRRQKGVVIRDPEEESTTIKPADTKSKDKGKGIMVEKPKPMKKKDQEDKTVQRYQVLKKRPQAEGQARRNMIMYLKNTAGFRLDYFKGMSYNDIPKRRKLNKEVKDVEDLNQHLEIVPDEDDDVYIEATPLARKVPVVDYHIIQLNTKPRYKIIRSDGAHQLYASFITLLKNFDREDLESLWSIVKERFSTSKPNNFSDDYLLTTLRAMFKRPDGQDNVWKSQMRVHGQAMVKSWKLCGVHIISFTTTQLILLVERRYPLSKFTLDQMLNAVRLQVEEQTLELMLPRSLKKNTKCFNAAGEELSAVKHKLMMLDTAAERRLMLLSQVKTVNEKCCCCWIN